MLSDKVRRGVIGKLDDHYAGNCRWENVIDKVIVGKTCQGSDTLYVSPSQGSFTNLFCVFPEILQNMGRYRIPAIADHIIQYNPPASIQYRPE